jgi:hypothetical protein
LASASASRRTWRSPSAWRSSSPICCSPSTYLETHAFGEFTSYGRFGPTEARIALIVLNVIAFLAPSFVFSIVGIRLTAFDAAGVVVAAGMLAMLLGRAIRNLRRLAALEPPRRWTPPLA